MNITNETEQWADPVDGASFLNELTALIRRIIILPAHAAETLALWIIHTYCFHL
jgi:hypothetical protein